MAERGDLKERLGEELRKYALVSAYLYVCFGALLMYKAALLDAAGHHVVLAGTALVKALILGKFLLLGDVAGVGTRLPAATLRARIAWRTVLLFGVLVLLTFVEEVVAGAIHHRLAATLAEWRTRPALEILAECLLLLLVLFPLVVVTEVRRTLGADGLRALLARRPGPPSARGDG